MIDLEISHEELKEIVNEKEKYERVKENISMMKSSDELGENNRIIREKRRNAYIAFNKYKMVVITKETQRKSGMEVMVDKNGTKWFNKKHIEENSQHSCL